MDPKKFTPHLPKLYYNTYRQYKENESLIVQWIHRTAAELRASTCVLSLFHRDAAVPTAINRERKLEGLRKQHWIQTSYPPNSHSAR
jgi:hypothetical protein